jgi:hypothetical protein
MSDMISREDAAAICDEAACETDSESARYEMFRARDAIRALPAVQPDAAAIRKAALKSALVAVNHVELFGQTTQDMHTALEQYARCRDAILALIDNTGDQAVAGAAPWPEGLIHLTNTRDMHCATEGCRRRVRTRFEGNDYCEPCGRKVAALAQKGGA